MATQPDNRQAEAAIAAALLLASRRYDLPALIRANNIRPRPFRRIEPTEALRADMAAPYFEIVRAWRAERDALVAAYTAALPRRGQQIEPGAVSALQREIDASAARIATQLTAIDRRFADILSRMERWHRAQWIARVKASTGLDVAMFTAAQDVATEIGNGAAVIAQQARAVHAEIQHKVGTSMLNSLLAFVPAAAVATALNGTFDGAKARAARIGVDQTEKASAGMDRARRRAAGLGRFRWRHTAQRHPRPAHQARDQRTYTEASAPADRAGMLPFCACWEEPLWD